MDQNSKLQQLSITLQNFGAIGREVYENEDLICLKK